MKLRFAFAVNNADRFEKKHFGDVDRYLIYELDSGKMVLASEEINSFKLLDEEHEHGSRRKGNAIIKFLKEKNVHILVSRQFCKNIKMVNEHFIPVKISLEHPEEIISILNNHMHWIEDELKNKKSNYKLFTIKSGILKTYIDENIQPKYRTLRTLPYKIQSRNKWN